MKGVSRATTAKNCLPFSLLLRATGVFPRIKGVLNLVEGSLSCCAGGPPPPEAGCPGGGST